jgi:membrane protein
VFAELQDAFERVWRGGSGSQTGSGVQRVSTRLRGIAYILAFGFCLLVSVSAFLA